MSWSQFCKLYDVPRKYLEASHLTLKIPPDSRGKTYQEKAETWLQEPFSLILEGPPGRGKTHFMYSLIRGLLLKRQISDMRFFRSKQLDDRILSELSSYGSSANIINAICEIEFLFLDDFGIETDSQRAERDYYDILDRRISNEMVTVLSTNLDSKDISRCFGSRISSRLKECVGIRFEGDDLRGRGYL